MLKDTIAQLADTVSAAEARVIAKNQFMSQLQAANTAGTTLDPNQVAADAANEAAIQALIPRIAALDA